MLADVAGCIHWLTAHGIVVTLAQTIGMLFQQVTDCTRKHSSYGFPTYGMLVSKL